MLRKSRPKRVMGQAVEILAYTAAWFSLLNTFFIILLSYDKVRELLVTNVKVVPDWSWFTLPIFFLIILVPICMVYFLEWFVIYPARQRFRNEQEVESGSPIIREIKELRKEIADGNTSKDNRGEIK